MKENESGTYVFPDDLPAETETTVTQEIENKGGNPGGDDKGGAAEAAKVDTTPDKVLGKDTYKSWDEVNAALEKGEGTAKELAELRAAKQALEEKFGEVQNPFANEELAKLNEFAKRHKTSDFSMYSRITNAITAEADPIETIVVDKVFRNPERYKGKEDMLREQIREDFNYDPTSTDEKLKQRALFKLGEAADEARTRLSEAVKDLQPKPNEVVEKRAADKQAVTTEWKDGLGKLEMKTIPIPIEKDGKPQPGFVDFGLTDEMKTGLFAKMTEYAANKGLPLNKETLQEAYGNTLGNFVLENLPKIALSIAQKARAMEQEAYDLLIHNPSGLSKIEEKPGDKGSQGYSSLFDN